jgi:hypothetical protein
VELREGKMSSTKAMNEKDMLMNEMESLKNAVDVREAAEQVVNFVNTQAAQDPLLADDNVWVQTSNRRGICGC